MHSKGNPPAAKIRKDECERAVENLEDDVTTLCEVRAVSNRLQWYANSPYEDVASQDACRRIAAGAGGRGASSATKVDSCMLKEAFLF